MCLWRNILLDISLIQYYFFLGNKIIVYYDVDYFRIGFVKVILILVWLGLNYCLSLYVDYVIWKLEIGSNKLCKSK